MRLGVAFLRDHAHDGGVRKRIERQAVERPAQERRARRNGTGAAEKATDRAADGASDRAETEVRTVGIGVGAEGPVWGGKRVKTAKGANGHGADPNHDAPSAPTPRAVAAATDR
jgi:hypothetical protein